MSSIRLSRIEQTDEFVSTDAACGGCRGCHPVARITLTDVEQDLVGLQMSSTAQMAAINNSWIKPLLLAVLASIISSLTGLSDLMAVGLTASAFVLGLVICHPLASSHVQINVNPGTL